MNSLQFFLLIITLLYSETFMYCSAGDTPHITKAAILYSKELEKTWALFSIEQLQELITNLHAKINICSIRQKDRVHVPFQERMALADTLCFLKIQSITAQSLYESKTKKPSSTKK